MPHKKQLKKTIKKNKRGTRTTRKIHGGKTQEPQNGALSWLDAIKLSFANMSAVVLTFFLSGFSDDED